MLRRRGLVATVCLAVLGLVLAGCGSADSKTAGSSNSSGQAVTLPNKPADSSKTPITIGFMGLNGNPIVNYNSDPAATAAQNYVNKNLGGIGGHPVRFVTCDDHGTPESVTRCASNFVSQKVMAVYEYISTSEGVLLTPLVEAGIPVILGGPVGPGLKSPGVVGISAFGLEDLLLPAVYGARHGLKSSALLLINSPTSQGTIDLLKPFYAKVGVKLTTQLVSATNPDLTPAFQTALANNPDSIKVAGSIGTCVSSLKAKQTLGYSGQMFVSGASCMTPEVVKQVGVEAVDGAIGQITSMKAAQTAKDLALFESIVKKYTPDTDPYGQFVLPIFKDLVLIATVADQVPEGSLTSASLKAQFKSLRDFSYFLDSGIPLTCDGKQLGFAPSVCTSKAAIGQYKGETPKSIGYMDFHDIASNP